MIRDNAVMNVSIGVYALYCHHFTTAWISLLFGAYWLWVYTHRLVLRDQETREKYLVRYHLVRTPWFRVFLHRIYRADKDRDVHNHPWPAFAFVLSGGYMEEVVRTEYPSLDQCIQTSYFHTRFSFSREAFRPGRYHRITLVMPGTWTLFISGVRRNTDRGVSAWGFLKDGQHINSREYLNLPEDFDFND